MSTRFYLPYTGDVVANTPFGSGWGYTGVAVRRPLLLEKSNQALAYTAHSLSGANKLQPLHYHYQWPITADVTISGTALLAITGLADPSANAGIQMRIFAIAADASTVLGTIYDGDSTTTTIGLPRELDDVALGINGVTARIMTAALTPTDIPAGGFLVVEIGTLQTYSGSFATRMGWPIVGTPDVEDQAFVNGSATPTRAPWVEFSVDLIPPDEPTGLTNTALTHDSLSFQWDAPADDSAESYDYRLGFGDPINLGDVTSHVITDLNPSTEYTFSVRSVNTVGTSDWVSIVASTAEIPPPADFNIVWDAPDERYYIHGVDRGVLYISGKDPVPWNGIIGIDETGDASRSILYRDGQIYLADFDPGDFEGSINAFFYPDAFSECLGIPEVADGFYVDNQKPKRFGLAYRSLIGSGTAGDMFGYQIHLVYNAVLQIGTRAHKTKTNQVGLMEMSFDMVATPVKLPGMRPTAHYIIDTRNMSQVTLDQLEQILYGIDDDPGSLPSPVELFDLLNFGSAITFVDHGDGTWTASGSYANVHFTEDGNIEILNVNGVDNGDGTYLLQDTP